MHQTVLDYISKMSSTISSFNISVNIFYIKIFNFEREFSLYEVSESLSGRILYETL